MNYVCIKVNSFVLICLFSGHFSFTGSALSPPKARYMRAVLPCIDAALNQTYQTQY